MSTNENLSRASAAARYLRTWHQAMMALRAQGIEPTDSQIAELCATLLAR